MIKIITSNRAFHHVHGLVNRDDIPADVDKVPLRAGRLSTAKNLGVMPSEEEDFTNEKLQLRKDFRAKKKNQKTHVRKHKVIIKPHATSMYSDFVSRLSSLDIDFATEALESIAVAFIASTRKSNLQGALIVAAKLLKTHLGVTYSDIISKVLLCSDMNFIKDILPWSLEDLESYMKELLNNWKLAYKNEAFSSIVALVSTFLAVFYSADKKWSISLGSFSMFLFDAKNSCKGATSLVDALLKVSTFVIGGLKRYMINGSYSGFLYSDDQLGELDSLVSTLQAQFKYVSPGNLSKFTGLDENTFDQELQRAITSGEKLVLLYDGPTKKFVMDKVRILRQLHCDFTQTRAAGGLRIAPFAFLVAGSTGLGKSSVNEILMRYILAVNGFNHQDQFIVTLNSQDKFYSTYKSYINGVIFDDFANVKKDFVEDSPCDVLLKFVNNIPYYLNMADIDLKGRVVAEPKVIGLTTNVSDIDSSVYSNQPSSIMRRLKVHIYAKVKPEFQKEGTIEIDASKVHAKFGDKVLAPDIWTFNVYVVRVVATPRPPKLSTGDVICHRDDNWHMEFVQWNGHDMKDASIHELLLYIKEATAIHFKEQNALVERSKLFGGDIVCKECCGGFDYCTCSNLGEAAASIHDLCSVVGEMDPDGPLTAFDIYEGDDIPGIVNVLPHSGSDESFYMSLCAERRNKIEQGLKDMLFSWIVEGKCNLDTVYADFVSNCSKELQYLLIVSRRIVEKWFQVNKRAMIEMCFPVELEGTVFGDYYSIAVREGEVKRVATISLCIESTMRIVLFYITYSLHLRWGVFDEVKYLFPIGGNYFLSRMDFPTYVTKIYSEWKVKIFVAQKIVNRCSYFERNVFLSVMFLIWSSSHCSENFSMLFQTLALFCIIFYPILGSFKRMSLYEAPRALSLLYKKEKEECLNDWSKLAPATLTLSTLYCSKSSIVDFYVEACEKWYLQPQSRLKPGIVEIGKRDEKHKFDAEWFKSCAEPFLDPLPTSTLRVPAEVRNAVGDNVWSICNLATSSKSNCFVVCSGCVLIPYHYVPRVACTFRFVRHNRGNKGNQSFDALIEPEQCIRVKNYDLAMVWVPKTRDVRNLIDCFPTEFHETSDKRSGRVASRDTNGDLEWSDVRELSFTSKATSGMGYSFQGIFYIWNGAKEGKCLSPVISDDKNASISGLHIGGSTKCRGDGGYIAYGVTPTRQDLLDTKILLERYSTVIPMSSSGDFTTECMGVEVLRREIKKKSCYLRMEDNNSAYFLGSSLNCNRTPKSQVKDTPIKVSVKKLFDIKDNWGPPKFKGPDGHSPHEPWEIGMKKWIVDKPGLPFGLLNKAKIEYTNNLTHILFSEGDFWKSEIRTLTWDETVNGIPGKRFIDSMNFKSSIGFPFKGSKKLFSTHLGKIDGWQDKRVLDPKFIEEAEKIEALYREGKRYYPWFTSTLKDEPTLETKDKVRVFQATSTPFQLVMRKYTLGICRFLQMNPLDSECAVGIDPCSSEWNEMYNHLKQAQTPLYDRWFAIDYKAYDTSIPSQMIMAIGRIFVDIAKIAGYTKEEIIVLNSIFSELSFSIVDFNGDVLMLDGANPSGNSLTVFINSLCNSLLMRIYFYHLYPRRKFTNNVRMMSYGDDLIAAVGSLAGGYTMKGYAKYLAQFGFVVTPAQKDEELKSFSRLREIDFLKRKFVWSADYGAMIAPLEENSIYKRLCNYMTSETSVEVIVGANIDGALDEWAFYGKSIYLDRQKKLIKIVEEFELHRFVHRLYMTYEQRVFMWRQNNADPAVMGKGQSMDTDRSNCDSDWLGFFGWGNIISKMGIGGPPHSHNSGSISSDDQMSIKEWTNNTINNLSSFVDTKNLQVSGELIPQNVDIIPHSSFVVDKQQILSMTDNNPQEVVNIDSYIDDTRKGSDSTDNTLEAFFSRPVKISSFDWTPGTSIVATLNPWASYLSNKRVSNRIANYKLMRGTMRVKFMINGNSFFYGRLMISYHPFHTLDTMTLDPSVDGIAIVQFSQMPRLFLDPTTSAGGEMSLPFFWYNDYLDITGDDYTKLGRFVISEISPLKHTTGDTSVNTRVSVSIYAWMENVQLEAPTTTNPLFIVPQSTNVSPFSTFDEIEAVTKPIQPVNVFMEPRGASTTILTDVPDTTNKLTMTKDQCLSLDPRIVGLGPIDELNIAHIASTESLLVGFNWDQEAAREDLLWNVRVTPALFNVSGSGTNTRYFFTAACGAILPFKYWNGTFKIRMQIVASAFHRGRLAIVYDPHKTAVPREDNVTYTQIVDIASCRDITFKVGPNQDRTLLTYQIPGFDVTNVSDLYSGTALPASEFGNGTISVYVLNELTTSNPDVTIDNSIRIIAYTSMDSDFQVFVPSGNSQRYTIVPQSSGVIDPVQESEPNSDITLSLDQPNEVSINRLHVYSGERIDNFRQLLKRYHMWGGLRTPPSGTSLISINFTHKAFPAYKGAVAGSVHSTTGAPPNNYNFFSVTLLNYFAPAFQAWRGAIRYKLYPRVSTNVARNNGTVQISERFSAAYELINNTYDVSTVDKASRAAVSAVGNLVRNKGSIILSQTVNPVIEYEIPWYENFRFCPGKVSNWTVADESNRALPDKGATVCIDATNTAAGFYDVHVAAGSDFNFYFFTGWPPMYYNAGFPAIA